MNRPGLKEKTISGIILLILPLLLVFASVKFNDARGPFWLGTNLDPEYVYLLNGLNLANFQGVGHIDHPGTPVQALCALVIRTVYWFAGTAGDLNTDVLTRPEIYLQSINTVLVMLNASMFFLLGWLIWRYSKSIWTGVWFQVAPFFSITLLHYGLTRVTPEPLLFMAGMVMVAALAFFIYRDDDGPVNLKIIVIFGLIAGFGIAVKITFFPVVLIPLFLIPRLKWKSMYVAAAIGGFVVFTLPIIRQYPRFFQWIFNLFSHSGRYGSGPSGLIPAGKYVSNINALLGASPFFTTSLVCALVVLVACVAVPSLRRAFLKNRRFTLLFAVTAAQVTGLLMVAKHSAPHYMLPVLTLSGLSLFLSWTLSRLVLEHYTFHPKCAVVPLVLVGIVSVLTCFPLTQVPKRIDRLAALKNKQTELHNYMTSNYKDYAKVFFYTASSPHYALKFGSDISRSTHADSLDRIYPGVYFYDIWTRRFTRFDFNRPIKYMEIEAEYSGKIIFQGSRDTQFKGKQKRLIYGKGFLEHIFMLK